MISGELEDKNDFWKSEYNESQNILYMNINLIYIHFLLINLFLLYPIQFSHSVLSDSMQPHGFQHATLPCPSPTSRDYSISCLSSRWCHPTISSSVVLFSSHLQSFSASGSFAMSQFFPSGGQSTGVSPSASALPMNTQDQFPLGLTGWIFLQ